MDRQAFGPLLTAAQDIADELGLELFLVGGAVRDALLKRPVHDLDFVVNGPSDSIARALANRLRGHFFILDSEHQTSRVIVPQVSDGLNERRNTLDFAAMRGDSIEDDLRSRDFTINAMALRLASQPLRVIDPCGGRADLNDSVIRVVHDESVINDPIRALRAIRLALELGFSIDPFTAALIREASPSIRSISAERIRDELFNLLALESAAEGIQMLGWSMLPYILPHHFSQQDSFNGQASINRVSKVISSLDTVESTLADQEWLFPPSTTGSAIAVTPGSIKQYLGRSLVYDRPADVMHHLVALCAASTLSSRISLTPKELSTPLDDRAIDRMDQECETLKLSNAEKTYARKITASLHLPFQLSIGINDLTQLEIYRYFRDTAGVGPEICILSLAFAELVPHPHSADWSVLVSTCHELLYHYWHSPKVIEPDMLVDGHDLMQTLSVEPGPRIGQLLEIIREEQVKGTISTRDEAFSFLHDLN
ncbi:MAG: hypothetical protein ABFQ89_00955 [Chloroflexota bacterium]